MGTQTLSYEFPFSAFAFPTDLSFMVIVPGKSSAFFKVAYLLTRARRLGLMTA
jgi:hypothetical protein